MPPITLELIVHVGIGGALMLTSFPVLLVAGVTLAFTFDSPRQPMKNTIVRICMISIPIMMFIGGLLLIRCTLKSH